MAYGALPHAEPDGDEPDAAEPDGDEAPLGPFGDAIKEAFPDQDWTPDKLDALKEAIRVCYHEDEAGESGGGGLPPKGPPGGSGKGLAIVFGGAPKK